MGRPGRAGVVLAVLWGLASPVLAQALDYDAFSDPDGNITTEEHGRELAERVSRPPCLVPVLRELSGWCVPTWSHLDFLGKDRPGGARLRKALFDGFEERARRRGLENQLVLSAMNALIGVRVATTAMRQAEAATSVVRAPETPALKTPMPSRLKGLGDIGAHGTPIDPATALNAAMRWLGPGYKELGPGVYRSADGLRQFRMTGADLAPTHGTLGSHVHFEALDGSGVVVENLHLPVGR